VPGRKQATGDRQPATGNAQRLGACPLRARADLVDEVVATLGGASFLVVGPAAGRRPDELRGDMAPGGILRQRCREANHRDGEVQQPPGDVVAHVHR
jgi:hypothetical protein